MKMRYVCGALAVVFLILLSFATVGTVNARHTVTIADASTGAIGLMFLIGVGIFWGYVLGHEDAREEYRR